MIRCEEEDSAASVDRLQLFELMQDRQWTHCWFITPSDDHIDSLRALFGSEYRLASMSRKLYVITHRPSHRKLLGDDIRANAQLVSGHRTTVFLKEIGFVQYCMPTVCFTGYDHGDPDYENGARPIDSLLLLPQGQVVKSPHRVTLAQLQSLVGDVNSLEKIELRDGGVNGRPIRRASGADNTVTMHFDCEGVGYRLEAELDADEECWDCTLRIHSGPVSAGRLHLTGADGGRLVTAAAAELPRAFSIPGGRAYFEQQRQKGNIRLQLLEKETSNG